MSGLLQALRPCRGTGVLLLAMTAGLPAVADLVTDDFNAAHDFSAGDVAGTVWDGFFYNVVGGNAVVSAADAGTSNAGRLTFRSAYGNWENGDNDGILLYRTVAGDFDAMLQVVSMNVTAWHDGGLMARVAAMNDAGAGEDWVAVKHFANSNQTGHRNTDNGSSSSVAVSSAKPWLRLARVGNTFTSYWSTNGTGWTQLSASTRTDMVGVAVQVGIWHATFSANEGVAQFDNFSLRLPAVWNAGMGGSWTSAANWNSGVPAGAGDWAMLSGALQSNGSVVLDGHQTIGRLTFDAANAAYSVDPGTSYPASVLTIDDTYEAFGYNPGIEVKAGTHAVSAPVALSNGVTVTAADGTGLTINGGISGDGPLVKTGSGLLTLSGTNTYSGSTQVKGGSLKLASIPAGTRCFYTFDNASILGQDSSGAGNHLSAMGSPAYSDSGRSGGAVYLDGASYFIRGAFPAGVPTGSSPYTIALWEKDNGSANTGGFVGWGSNATNLCNNFRFNGNNQLNNYWWGNDWTLTGLSANPKDGQWHHLVVTGNGTTQAMYVDGNPVGTYSRIGLNAQPTNFFVGKTTGDTMFKGWLDDVFVADRALSLGEIRALMLNAKPDNILPATTALDVSDGAVLYLDGARQSVTAIEGGGRVINGTQSNATLTVGGGNSSSSFSGTFEGPISIQKVGAGTLTLSGMMAHSGGTMINEGALVLKGPSLQAVLPAVLTNCLAWYDASDAATITTNGAGQVVAWVNKGTAGSALNAVQIAGGAGPTLVADALNSKPVLSVDGTTGLCTTNNLGISGAQNRTLFAVGSRKNSGTMCFAHIGEGSNGRAFGIISQPEYLFAYTWGGDILFKARPNDVYEIYDFMVSGGYGTASLISGGMLYSGARNLTLNTLDTPLYLGSRFSSTGQGNLAEVMVFNRALSQAERIAVETYLRAKWFLPDGMTAFTSDTVSLVAGSVLDLGGTEQIFSGLSGCGLVTNGALTVSGDIAPGGANTVGTLTFASVVPQSGTLLIDVEADGDSDRLVASGALNLAGLSLRIQNADQLKAGKRYVVAACSPGGLTGPFSSVEIGQGGWFISYNNAAGEVRLLSGGLLLCIH